MTGGEESTSWRKSKRVSTVEHKEAPLRRAVSREEQRRTTDATKIDSNETT